MQKPQYGRNEAPQSYPSTNGADQSRSMQVAQQQPYPAHSLIANHSETVPKKKDAILDYRRGTIHEEEGESGNFAEKDFKQFNDVSKVRKSMMEIEINMKKSSGSPQRRLPEIDGSNNQPEGGFMFSGVNLKQGNSNVSVKSLNTNAEPKPIHQQLPESRDASKNYQQEIDKFMNLDMGLNTEYQLTAASDRREYTKPSQHNIATRHEENAMLINLRAASQLSDKIHSENSSLSGKAPLGPNQRKEPVVLPSSNAANLRVVERAMSINSDESKRTPELGMSTEPASKFKAANKQRREKDKNRDEFGFSLDSRVQKIESRIFTGLNQQNSKFV